MTKPAALSDYRMVNYYTFGTGTNPSAMWSAYNASQVAADMPIVKSLGFDTVRVFLWAYPGVFDYSTPTDAELTVLTDFYIATKAAGVKVRLCLFDHWGNYGQISGSETWIAACLGALPDFTNIHSIEIQNETKYGSTASYTGGFDSGWPGYPTVPSSPTIAEITQAWAQQVIPYIRSVANGVPVTLSCTSYEGAPPAFGNDLAAIFAVLGVSGGAAPDWYEWHQYGSPQEAQSILAAAAATVTPAFLAIGETGYSTQFSTPVTYSDASGYMSQAQLDQSQADYLQTLRWAAAQCGLPEPAPWILYDIPDNQYYGLYDGDGNIKPAGQLYQQWPSGTPPPMPDPCLRTSILQDVNGLDVPAGSFAYQGEVTDVNFPLNLTSTADYTDYHGAAEFSLNVASTTTASEGHQPGILIVPLEQTQPGGTYTFSFWAKGSGSQIQARGSWYLLSGGYLSASSGSTVTLADDNWHQISITAVAPSDAGYTRWWAWLWNGSQVKISDFSLERPKIRTFMSATQRFRLG